jgi:hypothetical protein
MGAAVVVAIAEEEVDVEAGAMAEEAMAATARSS